MSNVQDELDTSILKDLNDLKEIMDCDKDYTSKAICGWFLNDLGWIIYSDATIFELEKYYESI